MSIYLWDATLVDGEKLPVLEEICVSYEKRLLPNRWGLQAIGSRQLKALRKDLLNHWENAA